MNFFSFLNDFYATHSAPDIKETTRETTSSTSNDHNGLTLSTNSAPITTSTARNSTTSKLASSTAKTTTEIIEHQEESTTVRLTDISLKNQTSEEPSTVRYADKFCAKTLRIFEINLIFSEPAGEKKSTRRLVVTACYILLVFLFFCGIGIDFPKRPI